MWRLGTSPGLALFAGAWASLWAALPTLPYRLLPGGIRSPTYEIVALPGMVLKKRLQLPWDDVFIMPMLILFAMFAIASALLTTVIAHLDRYRTSLAAMRWLPRTLPCLAMWCIIFTGCLFFAVWLGSTSGPIGSFGWMLPAAFVLSMPFFCLRGDVISLESPPLLWLPRWPRSLAIALLCLAMLAALIFSALQAVLDTAWPATAAISMLVCWIIAWFVDLAISLPAIQAWQQRARWRSLPGIFAIALRREHLTPAAASDLRLAWIMCFVLAPPLILCAIHTIFVLPQAWQDISTANVPMPEQIKLLSAIASWGREWGPLALMIPTFWLVSMGRARTLHLTMQRAGQL